LSRYHLLFSTPCPISVHHAALFLIAQIFDTTCPVPVSYIWSG